MFNIKKCKSVHNECIYKTYKNKLNSIIKAADKNYYQVKLEINRCNMKKTWPITKEVIRKNKETQIQTEFKLPTGEVTSDKSTIFKQFSLFFVNISPTLSTSFDGNIGSPQST